MSPTEQPAWYEEAVTPTEQPTWYEEPPATVSPTEQPDWYQEPVSPPDYTMLFAGILLAVIIAIVISIANFMKLQRKIVFLFPFLYAPHKNTILN
ncbi:MAG: hypothetical protein ACOC6H_04810 [Thermoproteota archaeon]